MTENAKKIPYGLHVKVILHDHQTSTENIFKKEEDYLGHCK